MRDLLTHPEFARRIGMNGREHVRENFLIDGQPDRQFLDELTSSILLSSLPSFRIARRLLSTGQTKGKRYKKKWQSKVALNSEQSCPEE